MRELNFSNMPFLEFHRLHRYLTIELLNQVFWSLESTWFSEIATKSDWYLTINESIGAIIEQAFFKLTMKLSLVIIALTLAFAIFWSVVPDTNCLSDTILLRIYSDCRRDSKQPFRVHHRVYADNQFYKSEFLLFSPQFGMK